MLLDGPQKSLWFRNSGFKSAAAPWAVNLLEIQMGCCPKKESGLLSRYHLSLYGGAEGIRTPGLVNASHALCQLSYSPVKCFEMVRNQLLLCQGITLFRPVRKLLNPPNLRGAKTHPPR